MKANRLIVVVLGVLALGSEPSEDDGWRYCRELYPHLVGPVSNLRNEVNEELPPPRLIAVEDHTIVRPGGGGCGGPSVCDGKQYNRIVLGDLPGGIVVSGIVGAGGSSSVTDCNWRRSQAAGVRLEDGVYEFRTTALDGTNAGPACFQGIAADGRRTRQLQFDIRDHLIVVPPPPED